MLDYLEGVKQIESTTGNKSPGRERGKTAGKEATRGGNKMGFQMQAVRLLRGEEDETMTLYLELSG